MSPLQHHLSSRDPPSQEDLLGTTALVRKQQDALNEATRTTGLAGFCLHLEDEQ